MVLSRSAHAKELISESLRSDAPVFVTFKLCTWFEPPVYAMELKSILGFQVWPALDCDRENMIQAIISSMGDSEIAIDKVSNDEYTIEKKR